MSGYNHHWFHFYGTKLACTNKVTFLNGSAIFRTCTFYVLVEITTRYNVHVSIFELSEFDGRRRLWIPVCTKVPPPRQFSKGSNTNTSIKISELTVKQILTPITLLWDTIFDSSWRDESHVTCSHSGGEWYRDASIVPYWHICSSRNHKEFFCCFAYAEDKAIFFFRCNVEII